MVKIYEALKIAEQEVPVETAFPIASIRPLSFPDQKIEPEILKKMSALYWNIRTALPDQEKRIVQFVDASKSHDGSVLVRQFARTLTPNLARKVLLLDATETNQQLNHFGITPASISERIINEKQFLNKQTKRVGNTNLSVACFNNNNRALTSAFDSSQMQSFFNEVQQRFDFTIIDSCSTELSVDNFVLGKIVHGIVLIVEAEKTRWQKARQIQMEIEKAGGRILGVFVNKRRHYIPKFIYQKL